MKNFKNYIITGILSIVPLYGTYLILSILFSFFSKPGSTLIGFIFDSFGADSKEIYPFVGFVLTILFLYVLGLIVKNVLGKRIYLLVEVLLDNIPIVNKIYKTIKNVTDTLSNSKEQSFTKVVMIEYPRKNLWTLAMVTGESKDTNSIEYYNLFVPTTPNPTSGYMIIIKKTDAIDANISVEDGLSIIISGGMIGPDKLEL